MPDGRPTYAELAAAAGINPGQVKKDKQRGAPADTIAEYLAWRAANIVPRTNLRRSALPEAVNVGEQTARLRRAQADREELEIAERRGELIPAEEVKQAVLLAAGVYASQLDALPGRLANELAALNDPALILDRLRAECNRVRAATASALDELADRLASSVVNDGEAPAAPHTGPMGGSDTQPADGLSGAGAIP